MTFTGQIVAVSFIIIGIWTFLIALTEMFKKEKSKIDPEPLLIITGLLIIFGFGLFFIGN